MTNRAQANKQKPWNSEFIISAISLIMAAVVYFATRNLSKLGGVFVDYTLVVLVVLAILVLLKGFFKPEYIRLFDSVVERNNVTIGVCILLIYLIMLPIIGFLPSSYTFYFCFNLYLADDRFSKKNILSSALLTAVVVTAFYFIFHAFLEVPLPTSMWSE